MVGLNLGVSQIVPEHLNQLFPTDGDFLAVFPDLGKVVKHQNNFSF